MTKKQASFIIVFLSSLTLSFLHCPLFEIFFDDKEIFKYTGLVIAKGGVPYRDFFDHKPPLIFFLNYAGLAFNGWGLWLIDTSMVLTASLFFLNICNKQHLLFSWVLPVLFNLLLRDQFVSLGIGMTREYTTILVLLFFCAVFSSSRWKFYLMGLYSGLIFFMQQDQLLVVFPFIIYTLVNLFRDKKKPLMPIIQFIGAGSLVLIIVLLYFLYHNALHFFWQDAFVFNFTWYNDSHNFYDLLKNIRNKLDDTSYEIPFYIALVVGFCSLGFNNKYKRLLGFSILALLLSFCAAFISGKMLEGFLITYYFLPLAATIPIVLLLVFSGERTLLFNNKNIMLIFSTLMLLQPILGAGQYLLHLPRDRWQLASKSPMLTYLKSKNLKDGDFYTAFSSFDVYIYNELKIIAPSPWIYHFFWSWFPNWDKNNHIIDSITSDLHKHHTKYVLDYSDDNVLFYNIQNYQHWKAFLREYYEVDSKPHSPNPNAILWRLKNIKE